MHSSNIAFPFFLVFPISYIFLLITFIIWHERLDALVGSSPLLPQLSLGKPQMSAARKHSSIMLQTRIQTVLDGGVVSAVDVLYRIVDV